MLNVVPPAVSVTPETDADIAVQHRRAVGLLRMAALDLCDSLHRSLACTVESDPWWWGEKESALSVTAKLTALLAKLIPLERAVLEGTGLGEAEEALDPSEMELLQRYLSRDPDAGA